MNKKQTKKRTDLNASMKDTVSLDNLGSIPYPTKFGILMNMICRSSLTVELLKFSYIVLMFKKKKEIC